MKQFNITWILAIMLVICAPYEIFAMSKKAPKVEQPKEAPAPAPVPTPAPPVEVTLPTPSDLPEPIVGWPAEYDAFLKVEIAKYPELQKVAASRLSNLCPKFASVDKAKAFAAIIYGLALKESSYDRSSMYLETTFTELDQVTGLPVISEGLLQMSYQDAKWSPGCDFNYKKDKDAHFADWKNRKGKQSWKSTHPEKDTINPYKNLACGVYWFDRLLKNPKFAAQKAEVTLGRYWRAIRPDVFLPQIIPQVKKKMPECF